MADRVQSTLDYLEFALSAEFCEAVTATLRRLSDQEINKLYLVTHTGPLMGEEPHTWIAALLPLIEKELDLRRDLEVVPEIGPVVAPDLYTRGGGHSSPF